MALEKMFLVISLIFLTNFFPAVLGTSGTFSGCEDDSWYPFGDEKCVKFLTIDSLLTHEDAVTRCDRMYDGAQLVQINSLKEQEFVRKLIFDTYQAVDSVWLGAVRSKDNPFEFHWDDTINSALDFTHWAEGSPSDDLEKNCTQLTSHLSRKSAGNYSNMAADEDGLWTDVSCDKRNLIVCQKNQNWSLELLWPRDCGHVRWRSSTKNMIYPFGRLGEPVGVQCDFETERGGWTVIQQRSSGPENEFLQNWELYENGFGSPEKNYWIGLKTLNQLTWTVPQELRVELEDWEGIRAYAQYTDFKVSGSADGYRLHVDGYSGDAGDSLGYHNEMRFSAIDRDNDEYERNCAEVVSGAWWYKSCYMSSLNGLYNVSDSALEEDGMIWRTFREFPYSLKSVSMKIRDLVHT